jgi:hypothetical protein
MPNVFPLERRPDDGEQRQRAASAISMAGTSAVKTSQATAIAATVKVRPSCAMSSAGSERNDRIPGAAKPVARESGAKKKAFSKS